MSSTVTFDGGRRGWATTMLCHLCKKYEHEHISHFAYLTLKDGTWQFASLRDVDIQKIMDRIEPEEAAIMDTTEPGEGCERLFQACFKCCGLKVYNRELAFVKEIDAHGVCVEPAMPNNQFKKRSNKTMKSEAGDGAVRNLLGRVERKLGEETAQKNCV